MVLNLSEQQMALKNSLSKFPLLSPLLEAYPLRPLKEAPEDIKKIATDNIFPAINDGHAVYWDMDIFLKWVRKMQYNTAIPYNITQRLYYNTTSPFISNVGFFDASREMVFLIMQQYLHLLYQHTRATRYFDHEKIDEKIFRIATEIEVNRFPDLANSATFWATPNSRTFPETENCLSLRQTYAVLLKTMGGGSDSNGNKENSPESRENASEGGSNSKDDSDTNSNDKDASKAQNTNDSNGNGDREKSREKQRQDAIEAMTPQLHQFDADDDLIGDSAAAKHAEDYNVKKLSQFVFKRWGDKIVRKQMRRLRSTLRGEVSRSKRKTFARPSRRTISSSSLIKKGVAKDLCGRPKILVAVDMSGSMSAIKSQAVLDVVGNTFEDLGRPSKGCYICIFDEEVRKVVPFRQYKNILGGYNPNWGTNYHAVVALANELDVDIVIEIGDGLDRLSAGSSFLLDRCKQFYKAGRKWYDLIVGEEENDSHMKAAVNHNINTSTKGLNVTGGFQDVLDDLQNGCPRYVMSNDRFTNLSISTCVQNYPQYKKYFL